MVTGQDAAHGGGPDLVEVIEQWQRDVEFTVSVEVLSHPGQIGGESRELYHLGNVLRESKLQFDTGVQV
jgi:hypothetical protein